MKLATLFVGTAALALTFGGVASAATASSTPSATPSSNTTIIGAPGDVALGTFHRNLRGVSEFIQSGTNVEVYGSYSHLPKNSPFFTVIYGNGNCDPAAAFPVGPFFTDSHGRAKLAANVPLPAGVKVGNTMSMSVRIGDNQTDIDKDGKLGPTDVVAVPGTPSIGLVECDANPRVLNLS